jgi:hypothetical protein
MHGIRLTTPTSNNFGYLQCERFGRKGMQEFFRVLVDWWSSTRSKIISDNGDLHMIKLEVQIRVLESMY